MDKHDSQTRGRILRAALKHFAECGYEGASVQAIVDAARVTKLFLDSASTEIDGLSLHVVLWISGPD